MKNTMKLLGIIAFVALIGFAMASCTLGLPGSGDDGGSGSSGGSGNNGGSTGYDLSGSTYYSNYYSGLDYTSTITFSNFSNFTASFKGEDIRGTYSISGSSLWITVDGGTEEWTIINRNTICDPSDSYWYKQQ